VLLRDGAIGRWVGGEWQATMHVSPRHKLMFGGEYRYNMREFQYSYDDLEPRFYYLDDDRSSSTLGVFAQDEFRIRDDLTLSAGLRMDRYSEGAGSTVNPRLALIYNPTKTATLKALYGEAFRAPNPYERYYNTAQASQPMLEPETVRTYELVYEQYLGSRYAVNVSAYHYEVAELISQTATDEGDPFFGNLDSARANGVELEIEGKYPSGAHVRASYALQRAEDGSGELSSSPQGLGKLNVSVPVFAGRLFAGLELQYQSASRTIIGGTAPAFCVANLTLVSRHLLRGLELSGGVFNAFDRKYGYAGAEDHAQPVLEQDGRTFRGSFTYRF
jgi:outer membrane receptor for ferrienterochelin and colicins